MQNQGFPLVRLKSSPPGMFYGRHITTDMFCFVVVNACVARVTRRVLFEERELLTLLEHSSSPSFPPRFSVGLSFSICSFLCIVHHCLSCCPVYFGHGTMYHLIHGLSLSLWHFQKVWRKQKYLTYLCMKQHASFKS